MTALITLIIAGCLGGLTSVLIDNYELFTSRKIKFKVFWKKLIFSSIIGVIASLTVPLFLHTIGSNMVTDLNKLELFTEQFFLLLGFSILVGIYSQHFIDGLSKKILNDLKEKKADKADVEKIMETQKEIIKLSLKKDIAQVEEHLKHEKYDTALATLQELEMKYDYDQNALNNIRKYIAYVFRRMDNIDKAIEYLEKVLESDSKEPNAIYNLACYKSLKGDECIEIVALLSRIKDINSKYANTALMRIKEEEDFKNIKDCPEFLDFLEKI